MNRFMIKNLILGLLGLVILTSCEDKNRLFEENKIIENNEWKRDRPVSFEFEVADTTQICNLFSNIRTVSTYPYYNLFLKVELINPEGVIILNDIKEGYLFNPTTGKPFGQTKSFLGISLGDLYDQRILLIQGYKFLMPGKYKLRLSHYMRDIDPVLDVMSIGYRVERKSMKK